MEKRWTLRMPEMNRPSKSAQNLDRLRSEGDLNLSPHRRAWAVENISPATQRTLDEDAGYFLHQSLSTPCLNALKSCQGAWIQDVEGRRYLDFHGNNVHQVGFGHQRVRSEEHTSELQSHSDLVCRLLLEKKNNVQR